MSGKDLDGFKCRHIGPSAADVERMLEVIQASSLDALVDEAIPTSIRLPYSLQLEPSESEAGFLERMRQIGNKNESWNSFIGQGYYDCVTPSVILRNVIENPSWYTPYTPYQAEVAQGRLEALLNFQTMVQDLTGMDVANASLLDEATAAAEAMTLTHRLSSRHQHDADRFVVASNCFRQTIEVVRGRAEPLGIKVEVLDPNDIENRICDRDSEIFGVLLQSPDAFGEIHNFDSLIEKIHSSGGFAVVASDLLALTMIRPPGDMGADVVVGNAQRFGVPMGYGGPHAAFFSVREAHVRQMPGRLIGVSVDAHGRPAYRMALQTREQHIRRERATSNICTAQALLANVAGFYAVYHGPDRLKHIASRIHHLAQKFDGELRKSGWEPKNQNFFDTIYIGPVDTEITTRVKAAADREQVNLCYFQNGAIGVAFDETSTEADVYKVASIFNQGAGRGVKQSDVGEYSRPSMCADLIRNTPFLTHSVFNSHHSELEMMRYLKRLENKDIGLDRSMIALGSCTMKLNSATEMLPVTWPLFSRLHPFTPAGQARGYAELLKELEDALCLITEFDAVSLQPNSGAQGELAGLLVIRAYQRDHNQVERDVVLIPASAHGTNPASAVMAGMRVVVVDCSENGDVDLLDLGDKVVKFSAHLSALMITYPSTHGVFEDGIQEICRLVHKHGGLVYMDGANMNAQVGLTSPARIGADVCHLNLHKTFAIPHGGGGPGMGPIAVASHLKQYLPGHPYLETSQEKSIPPVSAAPWGSASILLISYGYIRLLGPDGITEASKTAILNANYMKARLETHFDVLYTRANGRVAHELIFDLRPVKAASGITEEDVAKRLIDYGFHAPTVSFPVPGTLMIEPTESECLSEIDRFCDAMLSIHSEIQAVQDGRADAIDNVLKHAPHTAADVTSDTWTLPYSRRQAAYPLPFVESNKFWPPVSRIDNTHGDRNLVCSCPPVSAYVDEGLESEN